MVNNWAIYFTLLICWLLLPMMYVNSKYNLYARMKIWWKQKDKSGIVIPSIFFFVLPFLILSILQNIENIYKNNNYLLENQVIEIILKIIPITTIGTFILQLVNEREKVQSAKDSLALEMYDNYLAVHKIYFMLQASQSDVVHINVFGNPIQDMKILWSDSAYKQSIQALVKTEKNVYIRLSEIYGNASLIINRHINDPQCSNYWQASLNSTLMTTISILLSHIQEGVIALNNKSETGLFVLNEVTNAH
ncbi:hypothetical protein ACQFX9_30070 [Aliinostoc sp. HNIBRCY26]|uniref:hypothetical protein n=1 Tax=Aliinostoc sp. HNIBRCY26 TaxID=3418997 RepID=UPI003CFDF206